MGWRLLAAVLLVTLGCGGDDEDARTILGVWRTSEPRYAERYLEIRPDALVFGQGEGRREVHALVELAHDPPFRKERRYRLRYAPLDDPETRELVLYVDEASGTKLRLENQEFEWRRSESP